MGDVLFLAICSLHSLFQTLYIPITKWYKTAIVRTLDFMQHDTAVCIFSPPLKWWFFLTTPQEFRFKSVQWGLGIRFFHKPPAWIWDEVHRYHLGNTQFSSLPGGHVLQPGRYFCTLLDTAERLTMFSWLSRTKIISSLCTSVVFYPNFH